MFIVFNSKSFFLPFTCLSNFNFEILLGMHTGIVWVMRFAIYHTKKGHNRLKVQLATFDDMTYVLYVYTIHLYALYIHGALELLHLGVVLHLEIDKK